MDNYSYYRLVFFIARLMVIAACLNRYFGGGYREIYAVRKSALADWTDFFNYLNLSFYRDVASGV